MINIEEKMPVRYVLNVIWYPPIIARQRKKERNKEKGVLFRDQRQKEDEEFQILYKIFYATHTRHFTNIHDLSARYKGLIFLKKR
jgi:hypothetical protein